MDNPWANAWNDGQKPVDDQETDIATPSWSTGIAVRWAEPSNAGSLWNTSSTDAWKLPKSPYDDIPIGRTASIDQDSPVVEHHDSIDFQTAPTTPASPKHDSLPPSPSTRSGSPYEFNTFETADANASLVQDSFAWDAESWAPPAESQDQPQVDEWELAKLQKQKQDQHVPPELLISILEQLKELSNDLWSDLEEGETRQPSKDFLTDVPGLKSPVERLVPDDLVLSPNVQFARTFTSKRMNEALRLTRHLPITLSSPMSVYMASKGSTAWETFVKSKLNIGQDDILPPGWRMVAQEPAPTPEVKKKTGGLFSFLGLKNSETTTEPQKLSPSSSRPASMVESMKSPKSSMDGSSKPDSERRSSLSQPSALPSTSTSTFPSDGGATSQLYFSSPNTEQGMAQEATKQSAPSAMSRFFGRFSRSSTASSNSARSLALSSDDIDFLGDIAPSAQDDADYDNENSRSLTNVIISAKSPSSLSATPLPQPLPPPPKFSRPGPGSVLQADDPFSLLDPLVDEQPLTAAESNSIQSLVPTVPSTSWQMPKPTTPPITSNSRRKTSPQRRHFTAVMSGSGRSTPSNLQASLPPPPLPLAHFKQPPLINPPLSQPPAPFQRQPTSFFDDDEFSDFMSSPAKASPTQSPLVSSDTPGVPSILHRIGTSSSPIGSYPNPPSERSLLHRKNSSKKSNHKLLDDEFDEFVSSPKTPPLRTPTPPRPPSKKISHVQPPPPQEQGSVKGRDSLPTPPLRKTSRAADHARTLSLLETAAARPGRWPAPPSPLPQAIAPPPSTSFKSAPLDIFDDAGGGITQLSQSFTGGKPQPTSNPLWNASPAAGSSPNTLLPSRTMSPPLVPSKVNGAEMAAPTASSDSPYWSLSANSGGKPLKPAVGNGNKPTSGLSAQDLSFFEGL